ncbi:divergent polysaccharide deacetylase [Brevibacillus borstelensis AK1]|uniref:Divergent polysaccharide deacetylase n=2 Tax=Brevibacillus TaxID=55080 RepID=M8DHU9_9BACL|nr:divergent polysaccharide deacetylase family protein [Brevibacillus borstelensis]EMT53093.1 divergent polysaccharide deacetylase [Brevibacillus borstelensis AK1]KKX55516.1 sugar deacetylase [Brevibacillus borstelensis cifa_chp40]MED2007807.1 divergent polysaccharide deacetylase family protein [Brevibacillus borstelensis]
MHMTLDKRGSLQKALAFTIASMIVSISMLAGTTSAQDVIERPPLKPISGPKANQVAFVIDDFGNNMEGTEEILALPVPLTVAVMPFLPSTKRDAELAHEKGHDVFVHLPMEPMKGKASWMGPGGITTKMSNEEIRKRVENAIDDVPHAIGMNNHMGSKATADERVMRIVLQVCKERGLIYLDSKTTARSVAQKIAKELGVPYLENGIFLDDVYTLSHITRQMERLCKRIDSKAGPVHIAIGHVGPPGKKTASVLSEYIPRIQKEASFVTISMLISNGMP